MERWDLLVTCSGDDFGEALSAAMLLKAGNTAHAPSDPAHLHCQTAPAPRPHPHPQPHSNLYPAPSPPQKEAGTEPPQDVSVRSAGWAVTFSLHFKRKSEADGGRY